MHLVHLVTYVFILSKCQLHRSTTLMNIIFIFNLLYNYIDIRTNKTKDHFSIRQIKMKYIIRLLSLGLNTIQMVKMHKYIVHISSKLDMAVLAVRWDCEIVTY